MCILGLLCKCNTCLWITLEFYRCSSALEKAVAVEKLVMVAAHRFHEQATDTRQVTRGEDE